VVEIFKGRDTTPPRVKTLEIHIPAMTLTMEYNKKIPLCAIVAIVYEIARMILKHILEQINEMEVEKYCGKRYQRGDLLRNGKRRRKIVTLLGEVILSLTRIRGKGIPLYNLVEFESGNYRSDIKAISVDSAVKMTYRDSRDEINRFTKSPSHQTIWRYTQEAGSKINNEFSYEVYFSTDKTKLHSRRKKIELTLIEGKNIAVRVNRSYEDLKKELNLDGLVLGDVDTDLKCFKERQVDFIHVFREVNYKLWEHGVDLDTRKEYVNDVKKILLSLKNSLCKPDLEERIKRAEQSIKEFADEMQNKGFWKVAKFFRNYTRNILLFAYKKLEGISIPWHNNRMERKMGEISKRMKNKWMSWSVKGAQNLASLVMKRSCERSYYERFLERIMKRKNIKWEVNLHQ